ncbi:MAG TPA: sigma-54 dependent transcriptional regulator [Dissulfurispiraceae bacterium]|nr:sigma-54 dependent transcriptional regulator [Dissulfurispiraceae bacterium]
MSKRLLVIDDDESVILAVRKALEPLGYEIETRNNIRSGLKIAGKYNLMLLDLMLKDGNGIDAVKEMKVFNPDTIVIVVTSRGSRESAIDAMKEGAYYSLEKPLDLEELKIIADKAFRDKALREELLRLRQSKEDSMPFHNGGRIVGKSRSILKVFKEIGRVAAKDLSVLISGERGTGRELVARAIHKNSRRKLGPFVAVNSGSITRELMEAELFGWEKGAFPGAVEKTEGKIHAAYGGTLFLDEISELDADLQSKLLHFLLEREYSLLGSGKVVKADVRIIGATNKDLKECVRCGLFREDLYRGFSAIQLKLPPLRERKEDMLPLARHFLKESIKAFELPPKDFSKDAERSLSGYDWPGNVRELENCVKRAALLSRGNVIERRELFANDYNACSIKEFIEIKLDGLLKKMSGVENSNLYETIIAEVDKALLGLALKETGGNQVKAAKALGINRNTLNKKMKEYKLI